MRLLRRVLVPVVLASASGVLHAEPAMPDEEIVRRFAGIIDSASRRHGVDADLIHAVIFVESSYDPEAVSPQGALGLMQLMPETARRFRVKDPWNPSQNVEGGVQLLKELLVAFDNDTELALAAYNSGPGAVIRAGHRVPANAETLAFVPRVLGHYASRHSMKVPAGEPLVVVTRATSAIETGPPPEPSFDGERSTPERGKPFVGIVSTRRPRRWLLARITRSAPRS